MDMARNPQDAAKQRARALMLWNSGLLTDREYRAETRRIARDLRFAVRAAKLAAEVAR